jgi:hypothetical protein
LTLLKEKSLYNHTQILPLSLSIQSKELIMTLSSNILSIFFALSLMLLNTASQARPIDDEKRQLIDNILKQTGTTNVIPLMTNQLTSEILNLLKKKNVPLDQNLVSLVKDEASTVMYEEFILSNKFNEIFYELYDEYFSIEQLKDIAAFYDSSAGKRILSAMSDISRRSMEQAQEHSKGIGSKVQKRLMERFDEHEKQKQANTAQTNKPPNPL